MSASDATDRTIAPYNTAYVRDDRSHLYDVADVDREFDAGVRCPETSERDVPPDFAARREAVLSFYGRRCGRCLRPVATSSRSERSLGYVLPVAIDREDRWALANLVAVCEPCYDLLSIDDPDRIGAFGAAYRDAAQFPQWLGDPRVAVERIPLSGRELWIRERLVAETSPQPIGAAHGRPSINALVAERACLVRSTGAARAIALGEHLAAEVCRPLPADRRLGAEWDALSDAERQTYEGRAADRRALVEGAFVPAVR